MKGYSSMMQINVRDGSKRRYGSDWTAGFGNRLAEVQIFLYSV